MKIFAFIVGLCLLFVSGAGQKSATLLIDTDQGSLPFINSVHIQKNRKEFQARFFSIKNIVLKDLDSGRYQVRYITYFFDTITEGVYIDEFEKIRISYPGKDFYRQAENLDSLIEFFLMSNVAEVRPSGSKKTRMNTRDIIRVIIMVLIPGKV